MRRIGAVELRARIVETEAYRGPADRAAHSWRGRRTARTEAMFWSGGHAYVFMLYGMHYNFNLVTGLEEEPHAVLVRAVEPVLGLEEMVRRRGNRRGPVIGNGPGKVCQALGIDAHDYGKRLDDRNLHLVDGPRGKVGRSPRVGIDYAGAWAAKPWRFFEVGNPYVSAQPSRPNR